MSAVGLVLQGDACFQDDRARGGLAELSFQVFALVDDRAEAGGHLCLPVRDLLVAQNIEAGLFEERPVVANGVLPHWESGDGIGIQLERDEREATTGAQDASDLGQRLGLVWRVLQRVDTHDGVG